MATGAEQVTLLSLGLDTGNYEAGARRIIGANERLKDSLGSASQAGDNLGRRLEGTTGLDKLVRQLDAGARAAYDFSRAQAGLQRGLDAGRITHERHAELINLARQRYLGIVPAAEAATGAIKLQGYQVQNLTAQFVDFAVQVGSGGGLFRPLLQQAPQAVDAVGGVGKSFSLLRQNAVPLLAGGALALVAGGLAEVTLAAERQQRAVNGLGPQLQGAQRDYMGAAREISAAAHTLGETTALGTDEARTALTRLAQVPGFQATRENLVEMGKLARDLGARFGEDVTQGATRAAEALRDPAAAARRYFEEGAEGIRGFDGDFIRHVQALQSSGRAWEAANAVAARLRENLDAKPATAFEAAWNKLNNELTRTGNAAQGASDGLGQAIAGALATVISKAADAVRGLRDLRDGWLNLPESLKQGRMVFGAGDGSSAPAVGGGTLGNQSLLGRLWNGPEGGAGASAAPRPSANAAIDYFTSQGWSREQAAGIVANLNAESGMDPTRSGDRGKAFGLAQWHPDRQAAFKDFAGTDIRQSTAEQQLAFVQHELTAGAERAAGDRLRGTTTAAEAGAVVSQYYERPFAAGPEALARAQQAGVLLRGYQPGTAAGAATTSADSLPLPPPQPPPPPSAGPMAADADGGAAGRLQEARDRGLPGAARDEAARRLATAESDLAATPSGSADFRDRTQEVERLRSELERLRPVQDQYTDSLTRQNDAGAELDPTMRAVRQRVAEFDEAMKQAGKTGNEPDVVAARGKVVAETLRGMTQEYGQQTDALGRTIDAQNRVAVAWEGGTQAAIRQQNAERALDEVRRSGITGDAARAAEVERLTKRYDDLTAAQSRARLGQAAEGQRDTLAALGLAGSMASASDADMNRAMADLRAQQFLARTPGVSAEDGQRFRENAKLIADMTTRVQQQVEGYRELRDAAGSALDKIGLATADALGTGKWDDWRKAGISAVKELSNEFLKLAVLNPLKNALFGGSYATIGGGGASGGGLVQAIGGWLRGGSGGAGGSGATAGGAVDAATGAYMGSGAATGSVISEALPAIVGHTGGLAEALAESRALPAHIFREAPRYHSGGVVGARPSLLPDEVPAVLRRKELVLTEAQQGAVARSLAGGRGGRAVTLAPVFNITTPNPDTFRKSQGQIASDIGAMLSAASRRL